MKKRSIPKAIILSIVTCGIYAWMWEWDLINGLAKAGAPAKIEPLIQFILTFVWVGYPIFGYLADEEYNNAMRSANMPTEDNKVLFIILGAVCPIALIAVLQSKINKFLP